MARQEQEHPLFLGWLAGVLKQSFIFSTWWGCDEVGKNLGGWETRTHTSTHTSSVHSLEFRLLCCTSYSPLSSPPACSQIRDSSVRSSDTGSCLPPTPTHSSPEPVLPSQLQKGAGPPKNHSSVEAFIPPDPRRRQPGPSWWEHCHFIDVWSYSLNMKMYRRLLVGTRLIFWSPNIPLIIWMSNTPKTTIVIKRTSFVNIAGKGSTTVTSTPTRPWIHHNEFWPIYIFCGLQPLETWP